MENNNASEVRRIAQEAIRNITELSQLVSAGSSSGNEANFSAPATASMSSRADQRSSNGRFRPYERPNHVSELRLRFPTTAGSFGRGRAGQNRIGVRGRGVGGGRPFASATVTRDIVILLANENTIPSRHEKAQLEKDGRIVTGMDIDRGWNEEMLRHELQLVLPIGFKNVPFQIMKNCHGSIIPPNIPNGRKIDAALLLRSIAPTGCIYVQLMDDPLPDDILEITTLSPTVEQTIDENEATVAATSRQKDAASFVIPILDSAPSDLADPVEILKFLQNNVVTGRPLEVSSIDSIPEGETNYITVNREDILRSTFDELTYIHNPRNTFQVDFMGEDCIDLGGPRKEWIRLMNQHIKKKYFENGLRPLLSNEYFYVGLMFSIAMLQNGQLPSFLSEAVLQDLISVKANDACVAQMQLGMESLGMHSALCKFPQLAFLLRPGGQNQSLTVQKLLQLIKPCFSEQGSNALHFEREAYQMFVKYAREVAANRRKSGTVAITLNHILQFTTGASEEPILGFTQEPKLKFVIPKEEEIEDIHANQDGQSRLHITVPSFLPSAHTCINVLNLPRATHTYAMPDAELLYSVYDLCFGQDYFGIQ